MLKFKQTYSLNDVIQSQHIASFAVEVSLCKYVIFIKILYTDFVHLELNFEGILEVLVQINDTNCYGGI